MSLLRREQRATFESPTVPLTSTTLLDWLTGPKVAAGVNVTQKSALGMSSVWRSCSLLAGTIGALPLHAYRNQNGQRVPAGDRSSATQLLSNPNPTMTPFELWELAVLQVALWGNSYHRILRDQTRTIRELWPIPASDVQTGRAKGGEKFYQVSGDNDKDGRPVPYSDDEILHIPGMGYDGITGCSPIRMARQGIGLSMAAEEYGARLFGSGSLASGILQTEQRLSPEQADVLKERWKAKATGLENSHEAVVLDRGAKFQQLTIPPEDAQFIETRRFQVSEIARLYGIPPHMLMDMERSTSWGTGIEQQSIGFVKFTLQNGWLARFEQRISRLFAAETVYARYSVEGLLRGDSAARSAFYRTMWELGAMSTNEIRALEELPPIPGGDTHYRPMNFGKLGEYAQEGASEPAAAPAEEDVNA